MAAGVGDAGLVCFVLPVCDGVGVVALLCSWGGEFVGECAFYPDESGWWVVGARASSLCGAGHGGAAGAAFVAAGDWRAVSGAARDWVLAERGHDGGGAGHLLHGVYSALGSARLYGFAGQQWVDGQRSTRGSVDS